MFVRLVQKYFTVVETQTSLLISEIAVVPVLSHMHKGHIFA